MDDLKVKKDPNCEEFICKQESLYNKYKIYISKDEDFSENQELNQNQISNNETIKCPIGKDTLGFYSWNYLHTMAAYYPDKPTEKEKSLIQNLIESFAYFYPCKICSSSFQKDIKIRKWFFFKRKS